MMMPTAGPSPPLLPPAWVSSDATLLVDASMASAAAAAWDGRQGWRATRCTRPACSAAPGRHAAQLARRLPACLPASWPARPRSPGSIARSRCLHSSLSLPTMVMCPILRCAATPALPYQ